jgi:hypothetical protein
LFTWFVLGIQLQKAAEEAAQNRNKPTQLLPQSLMDSDPRSELGAFDDSAT